MCCCTCLFCLLFRFFTSRIMSFTATVLTKQSIVCVIRRVVLMFACAMLVGIGNWIFLGLPLLPTISDTWTHPPASYISRYVVGTCWLFFAVAQVVIYRSNQVRWCGRGHACTSSLIIRSPIHTQSTRTHNMSWKAASRCNAFVRGLLVSRLGSVLRCDGQRVFPPSAPKYVEPRVHSKPGASVVEHAAELDGA